MPTLVSFDNQPCGRMWPKVCNVCILVHLSIMVSNGNLVRVHYTFLYRWVRAQYLLPSLRYGTSIFYPIVTHTKFTEIAQQTQLKFRIRGGLSRGILCRKFFCFCFRECDRATDAWKLCFLCSHKIHIYLYNKLGCMTHYHCLDVELVSCIQPVNRL